MNPDPNLWTESWKPFLVWAGIIALILVLKAIF